MSDEQEKQGPDEPERVRFHFLKNNGFRTVHANGVLGGLTPTIDVAMAFYSQRQPIPDQVVHFINQDDTLGAEIADERIVSKGFVREVEVNVVMDLALARTLMEWLQDNLIKADEVLKESKKEEATS